MYRCSARTAAALLLMLSTGLTGATARCDTAPAASTQALALAIGRSVVAGGGDESEAGTLHLRGTIGQAIARLDPGQSGARSLQSGYWRAAQRADALFADSFE